MALKNEVNKDFILQVLRQDMCLRAQTNVLWPLEMRRAITLFVMALKNEEGNNYFCYGPLILLEGNNPFFSPVN